MKSVRDLAKHVLVILSADDELLNCQAGHLAEALDAAAHAIRTAQHCANASPVPTRTPASERDTVIPPPPVPVGRRARRPLPEGVIDLSSRRRRGK